MLRHVSPGPEGGAHVHIGDTADVGGWWIRAGCPSVFLKEVARGGELVSLKLGSEGRVFTCKRGTMGGYWFTLLYWDLMVWIH